MEGRGVWRFGGVIEEEQGRDGRAVEGSVALGRDERGKGSICVFLGGVGVKLGGVNWGNHVEVNTDKEV